MYTREMMPLLMQGPHIPSVHVVFFHCDGASRHGATYRNLNREN